MYLLPSSFQFLIGSLKSINLLHERTPQRQFQFLIGSLKSTAADVRATKMTPSNVYNHANRIFSNGGVGKYNTFTHVDVRGYRSRW